MRAKEYKVNRERAIKIAMQHNNVSKEIAQKYSDTELKEVLKAASGRTYKLKADF